MRVSGLYNNMKNVLTKSLLDGGKALLNLSNYYKYGVFGTRIRLEASSRCQLKCAACVRTCRGSKDIFEKGIGQGYLSFKNFKRIIDENPWIRSIELSNWGEIFLNPELKEIIEYSYNKKIFITACNGVNLNTINEEMIECLVKYKFRIISVSLDGASNETYKIYRRGGNFNKVIENIKRINFYKQKYNSEFPILSWQFIVFGHNEHELPIARETAKKLNMHFTPKLNAQNWDSSYSPVKNKEFVQKETGFHITSVEEFGEEHKRNYYSYCHQLWSLPQINWDGGLLGCCLNIYSDFGNIFESGLTECLKKSEKYVYAKKMLLGKKKPRDYIACSKCPAYKNRTLPKPLRLGYFLGVIDRFPGLFLKYLIIASQRIPIVREWYKKNEGA